MGCGGSKVGTKMEVEEKKSQKILTKAEPGSIETSHNEEKIKSLAMKSDDAEIRKIRKIETEQNLDSSSSIITANKYVVLSNNLEQVTVPISHEPILVQERRESSHKILPSKGESMGFFRQDSSTINPMAEPMEIKPPSYNENREKPSTQEILNKLCTILSDNHITNEEVNIRFLKNLDVYKEEFSQPISVEKNTFCLLKKKLDINWSKKPYSKVVNEIDDYFNENNLKDFYSFSWSFNFIEFEKNYLDFNLKKSKIEGGFEDFKFSDHISDKIKLIFFISPGDVQSIELLKHFQKEKDIDLIPIHCEKVSGKSEASSRKENIESLGYMGDLYLIPESKNVEKNIRYEKYLNFTSNDNFNKLYSLCMLIDTQGYIRYIGEPENCVAHNYNVNFTNEEILNLCEILKNFEKDFSCQDLEPLNFHLNLKVVDIYNLNMEKETMTFVNPLKLRLNTKINEEQKENSDSPFDFLKNEIIKKFLAYTPRYEIKSSTRSEILISQMKKIKSDEENTNNYNYTLRTKVSKKFNNLSCKEVLKSDPTIILSNDLILHLSASENSVPHQQLIDTHKQIIRNPYFPNLNSISVLPCIGDTLPSQMNLTNEKGENFELSLNDSTPKIVILYYTSNNQLEINFLEKKIKSILEPLADHEVINIFLGQSLSDNLVNFETFSGRQVFTLPCENNFVSFEMMNNTSSFLNVLVLNKQNKIIFVSNGDDLDYLETFNKLNEDVDATVEFNNSFPITKDFWGSQFKPEFLKFLKLLESLFIEEESKFYQPILELSYDKEFIFESDEEKERKYQNLRIKVICKSNTKFIDNNKIQKYFTKFEKKYKGVVEIIKKPICNLFLDSYQNCNECSVKLSEEPFIELFLEEDNNKILCSACESCLEKNYNDPNRIYVRHEKDNSSVLSELLEETMLSNKRSTDCLENLSGLNCSLCQDFLSNYTVVWLSLTHLNFYNNTDFLPVIFCDQKCFSGLFRENKYDMQNEKIKLKELGIDRSNIVLRKIVLSSDSNYKL
jgi:hypothetical protein